MGSVDIIEQVYENGRLKYARRVATAPDYPTAAATIARLEPFRSVQQWRDVTYQVAPAAPASDSP